MDAPITALFGQGAKGVPMQGPVEFAALAPPRSPNWALAAPPGATALPHLAVPLLPVSADEAWARLRGLGERFPRTAPLAAWPERRQAQWVARTPVLNFPDIVAAEVVDLAGGAGLWLYSRSLFGWSDLGVNARRLADWVAEARRLTAA